MDVFLTTACVRLCCSTSCLISVSVGVRSCMVEESGTLESQLEATKVITTRCCKSSHVNGAAARDERRCYQDSSGSQASPSQWTSSQRCCQCCVSIRMLPLVHFHVVHCECYVLKLVRSGFQQSSVFFKSNGTAVLYCVVQPDK